MANVFGSKMKLSIFGESHGEAIGIVIDGIKQGVKIDTNLIEFEMQRRAPGNSQLATPRKEPDKVEIVSGVFNGFTTGAPICGLIYNTNTKSKDYQNFAPRPGHADFTARAKFNGFEDYRGGGHFSGRITAPLTFAGAICKQILKEQGIEIASHIKNINGVEDEDFSSIDINLLKSLQKNSFPLLNKDKEKEMVDKILKAKENSDSVGGIIECACVGVKAGIGSPFFESIESKISQMMFSIPAIKGIEFGAGFNFCNMLGSIANDSFITENEKIITTTNNNGGINGGITNGMPIVFKVAVKPTPSIAKTQNTINFETLENTTINIKGRHDPCIVIRALPVVEAGLAICILDSIL